MTNAVLVAGLLALSTLSAQRAPSAGNATIEGRVVAMGSNDPVRGARVILNTDPISDAPLFVTADDNGRFEFRGVAAGKYQLLATRDGFVRGVYGQRVLNGPGASIALQAGENLNALTVALTPMGAITGTVRDSFGEPFANVDVRALRAVWQDGRRVLFPLQLARTNDLGEYRLYYLEPGQYFVSATPQYGPIASGGNTGGIARLTTVPGTPFGSSGVPGGVTTGANAYRAQGIVSPEDTGVTYVPVYLPGVTELSQATAINLQPGATFRGGDFVLSEVRAVRIRGEIRDAASRQPVRSTSVVLVPPGDIPAGFDRFGTTTDAGTVVFRGVPPGAYELVASSGSLPLGTPSAIPRRPGTVLIDRTAASVPTAGDTRMLARMPLRISGLDIENVTLSLQPGFSIKGRIVFDTIVPAEAKALYAGLVVQLVPPDPVPTDDDSGSASLRRTRSFSMPGAVSPDGAFSFGGVFPGSYRVVIRGAGKLPAAMYVKSALLESADILNSRLTVAAEPGGDLVITLGTTPGSLEATVADERLAPVNGATVLLVPEDPKRQQAELYYRAVSDSAGKANLGSLVPGEYQAYALEAAEEGAWWDVDFLRRFEGRGRPVRIEAGGLQRVELKSLR